MSRVDAHWQFRQGYGWTPVTAYSRRNPWDKRGRRHRGLRYIRRRG